jgi:hypothetical protein
LLQQSIADFGIVGLGYGIFQISFLEFVQGDDNAEHFGKRVLEIPFGSGLCKLHFLEIQIKMGREVGQGPVPRRD